LIDVVEQIYIEDYLCICLKKFITDKSTLFARRQTELFLLAASTAAAATAFTLIAIAAAPNITSVHGIHLLSYRCLSIDAVTKIGG
jgi:hypothetical protein